MGPAVSAVSRLFVKEEKVAEGGFQDTHDGPKRRRNSLAFHITQFCRYEEDDYQALVDETVADIERTAHELGKHHKRQARESKMVKAARAIQAGDMHAVREAVVVNYKNINRQYIETHGGDTLLHMVCREGYYDMVAFIENPKNHSEFDDTPLLINTRNENGRTPIMLCFTAPSATCMGMQYGVLPNGNANSQPPEGLEEISDWIKPGGPNKREKSIRLLLKRGALVNDKDFHNFTILHYACSWGWASTVQLLLEYNADINAQTVTGKTPLHFAVEYGHEDIIEEWR
jgi:ankyrin repeat protein